MFAYVGFAGLIEFTKLRLRQPYGFIFKFNVDLRFAVICLI